MGHTHSRAVDQGDDSCVQASECSGNAPSAELVPQRGKRDRLKSTPFTNDCAVAMTEAFLGRMRPSSAIARSASGVRIAIASKYLHMEVRERDMEFKMLVEWARGGE